MYYYDVTILATRTLCGTYKPFNVTIESPVQLSDRDIRTKVINSVPDEYVSFGGMYKTERLVDHE